MNLLIFILLIVLSIFFMYISLYMLDKKNYRYIYLIYSILGYLMSFKIIKLASINLSANIVIETLFLTLTYLIIEKTTKEEFIKIVKNIFKYNLLVGVLLLFGSLYIPVVTDVVSINIKYMIIDNYKILLIYPILLTILQLLTYLVYNSIKELKLNIQNNIIISSLTILMVDSVIFNLFAYLFKIKLSNIILLILSNYLIKILLTAIYSYIISKQIDNKKVKIWTYFYYL